MSGEDNGDISFRESSSEDGLGNVSIVVLIDMGIVPGSGSVEGWLPYVPSPRGNSSVPNKRAVYGTGRLSPNKTILSMVLTWRSERPYDGLLKLVYWSGCQFVALQIPRRWCPLKILKLYRFCHPLQTLDEIFNSRVLVLNQLLSTKPPIDSMHASASDSCVIPSDPWYPYHAASSTGFV